MYMYYSKLLIYICVYKYFDIYKRISKEERKEEKNN